MPKSANTLKTGSFAKKYFKVFCERLLQLFLCVYTVFYKKDSFFFFFVIYSNDDQFRPTQKFYQL